MRIISPMTGAIAIRSPVCMSGKAAQRSGTGPVKTLLNHRQNHRRGDQQSEHGYRGRHPCQRKHAAEDEELAHESIQARGELCSLIATTLMRTSAKGML